MIWILVWITVACFSAPNYYRNDMKALTSEESGCDSLYERGYELPCYEIFISSQALYEKYNKLNGRERESAKIIGGSEYEIKPLYEILKKKNEAP